MTLAIVLLVFASILTALSQMLLRISSRKPHKSFLRSYLNPHVIAAYFMLFTCTFLSTLAYRTVDYKFGLAISFLSYVLVIIISHFYFKEKIFKRQMIGIFCIVCGIAIFNL